MPRDPEHQPRREETAGDEYERDLARDNRGESTLDEPAPPFQATEDPWYDHTADNRSAGQQKDRTGQAQSPVERTPNQPGKKREGHR